MSRVVRQDSNPSFFSRPYVLVAAGFGLGYLAKFLFGPPVEESSKLRREFERPMPTSMPVIDLPLAEKSDSDPAE
jgi:hypothetical protein